MVGVEVVPVRHLLSLKDLSDEDIDHLVTRGGEHACEAQARFSLSGLVVGSYFSVTSTRTRTAFASGALALGSGHIAYGPGDLQLNTGESVGDTAEVLSRMLDALVVRTAGDSEEIRALTRQQRMPVINAMSADEHPTQALADLTTLRSRFGGFEGRRLLYVGEGNNTAAALALALSRLPRVELCFCTPPGYGLDPAVLEYAANTSKERGGRTVQCFDPAEAVDSADVVYTTRWQTTGTSKADSDWRRVFEPFQVNEELMKRHLSAVVMHDLPAHRGDEITGAVLDGPASIAFEQAENKLHSAKAVLEWCILDRSA